MSNGTTTPWGHAPTGPNPFSREGAGPNAGLGTGWERERISYMESTQEIPLPKLQPTPSLPEAPTVGTVVSGPVQEPATLPQFQSPQRYAPPAPEYAPYAPAPQAQNPYLPVQNPYPPVPSPYPPAPGVGFAPAPAQYPGAPVGFYPQGFYAYTQLRNSPFAVASLIMALGSLIVGLTAPLGVLFGIVGLWQIAHNPYEYNGRGQALAGLIVGGAMTTLYVLVFVWAASL